MSNDAAPLSDDVALCHQIIRQLQQRVQELEREVAELKTVQAGIIAVDVRLGRTDRADEQRRPARGCVMRCCGARAAAEPTAKRAAPRVERMLSVVATARQQNRNVLELLNACCAARLDGSTTPSLLPAEAELAAD